MLATQRTLRGNFCRVETGEKADQQPHLILCSVADEALRIGESHVAGSSSVSHVIGNNFHAVILPHTDAAAAGSHLSFLAARKSSAAQLMPAAWIVPMEAHHHKKRGEACE